MNPTAAVGAGGRPPNRSPPASCDSVVSFSKLGLRDRTQAVVTAYESGLVTLRSREQRLSDEQPARIVWGLPS